MNKSSTRYWLRGGIWGLVVGAIVSIILYIVAFSIHDISDAYGILAENIFEFFTNILLISPLSDEGFSFGVSVVISAVWVFLLGSLLGFIYGKIKYRVRN